MDGSTTIAISSDGQPCRLLCRLGWVVIRPREKISGDAEWRGEINAKLDIITGVKLT